MASRKKIFSILIKGMVGIGSLLVIYIRLKGDLTPDKLSFLYSSAFSAQGMLFFLICLLLVPVNWGLESQRWRLITAPVERVSYKTALKSVYSGVCLGNLAPGRATEFLARIFYFEPQNRSKITVLHFINGMFQFSVTVVAGLLALGFRLQSFDAEYQWIIYATTGGGAIILLLFALCIYRIENILNFVAKKISRDKNVSHFDYTFSTPLLVKLSGLSVLRYITFCSQFSLILYWFYPQHLNWTVLSGVALYFLITSLIPMISVLEAAIRTAIALVVFKGSGIDNSVLALATVMLWFLNIVLPSAVGYIFLARENFNFKIPKKQKT